MLSPQDLLQRYLSFSVSYPNMMDLDCRALLIWLFHATRLRKNSACEGCEGYF
jgi:hypothetical protein